MNVEYLSDSSIFRITLRAALPASLGRAISCGFSAVAAGVREWPRMREQIPPPARYWWRLFHSPELVASSNFLEMSRKKLKKTLQTPDFFYFFDCVMLCVMMRGVARRNGTGTTKFKLGLGSPFARLFSPTPRELFSFRFTSFTSPCSALGRILPPTAQELHSCLRRER